MDTGEFVRWFGGVLSERFEQEIIGLWTCLG
jgi:hypothetical protein